MPTLALSESNRVCAVFLALAFSDLAQASSDPTSTALAYLLSALIIFALGNPGKAAPSRVDFVSLLLVGASLSPVLGTLTQIYSTDTVTWLTHLALGVHLMTMDTREAEPTAWVSPVSFNAGFLATLLMASRLKSALLIFSLGVLCAALLVFLPAALKREPVPSLVLFAVTLAATLSQQGFKTAMILLLAVWFIAVHSPRVLEREASKAVRIVGSWDLLVVEEEVEQGLVVSRSA